MKTKLKFNDDRGYAVLITIEGKLASIQKAKGKIRKYLKQMGWVELQA